MADRIGVLRAGELIVTERKADLMKKLGKRQLRLTLQEPLAEIPAELGDWPLSLTANGTELEYTFDANHEQAGIPALLRRMGELRIPFKDLSSRQSSLEEIFVDLVSERR